MKVFDIVQFLDEMNRRPATRPNCRNLVKNEGCTAVIEISVARKFASRPRTGADSGKLSARLSYAFTA